MKKKLLITLMGITMLFQCESALATIQSEVRPDEIILPSSETEQQLNNLAKPGTRQAPDEEGWAQKETPISGTNASIIILMISATLFYAYFKKPNIQNLKK